MKSLCFSFVLAIFFFLSAYSQQNTVPYFQKKIDSLLITLEKNKIDDSLKLSRYYQLYRNYMRLGKTQEVERYVNRTIQLAQKINQPTYIADGYYRLGFYYHNNNDYLLAEENYRKSIKKYDELGDKDGAGGIYQNLSALYINIPDYIKALESNLKAVELFTEINAKESVGGCYVNIASIYSDLKQHSTAITYLEKALKIFLDSKGNEYGIALCQANLGDIYFDISDEELRKIGLEKGQQYRKSLEYLATSLHYAQKSGEEASLLGSIFQTQGNVYNALEKKELAQEAYLKSISSNRKLSSKGPVANSLLVLANFYISEAEYDKAEPLLGEILSIGNLLKALKLQRDANLALSNMSEKQGNYSDALTYYKAFIFFKEQIFNEEKEKEVTRKQLRLDFSIKERDYQTKQQLTSLALDKQVLLVKERQQQLLLKQQQLALSDKEKNIQRLNFLQKQATLEQEKLQKENQLKQQGLIASLEKEQAGQKIFAQESRIKLNRNFSIFFGVLAVILLGAALLVYRAQRKTAKLNKLVLAQKEELEKLGKVKDRIFSVVSHDMRTPVNSLISFISLLEHGNLSEEKLKRYSANLKNSLGYTSNMMENLLNWASSQLEGYKPFIQSVVVHHCITEVVNAQFATASNKNITITHHLPEGLTCLADENMLSLVIRNLLSNAIKFTPINGNIDITAIQKAHVVEILVKDTGVGLQKAAVDQFNASHHTIINTSTLGTNNEKGTGIGLSLCKTFMRLMSGKLSVKSELEKGTEFAIQLPK